MPSAMPGLRTEALVGEAGVVAVAAARPQRVDGDEHAGPDDEAGGDRVAQPDVDVV